MGPHSNSRWTPEEEDRLREMLSSGLSKFLIAAKLKRAVAAVEARAYVLGLSSKAGKDRDEDEEMKPRIRNTLIWIAAAAVVLALFVFLIGSLIDQ